ncbi:MAG: aminotransferase class V-fold PLP-dependent enzyme, partial [Clostridia bacterium]|nr:aminotransferase class V-fold PLP-dependent enzyme [Clostridia bacterium]
MKLFINDYQEGCIPEILAKMQSYNYNANSGYGTDKVCDCARNLIKKAVQNESVDVHFVAGGTLTNKIVISSFLRPFEGVVCADTAHIATHETGAIEQGGHKVLVVKNIDGKITPNDVENLVNEHITGLSREHTVKPAMVYISQSTEMGTVYSLAEMKALSDVCKKHGLIFYIDGARILYSLFSKFCDFSLADICSLCDVFYIGGTKVGALLGEALVICNENLKKDFRYLLKQSGALMAKGFVMGVQF